MKIQTLQNACYQNGIAEVPFVKIVQTDEIL